MHEAATAPGVALAFPGDDTLSPEIAPADVISWGRQAKPLTTRGFLSLLYDDLKVLATRVLSRETRGRSMGATELVHESFLKLVAQTRTTWQDNSHFMAVSAQAMRRILIDDARTRTRQKRGGKGRIQVELQDYHSVSHENPDGIAIVDEIFHKLNQLDPVHARILQLRVGEALEMKEIAQILGVSSRTVERHWAMIRAWTFRELEACLPEERASDISSVARP